MFQSTKSKIQKGGIIQQNEVRAEMGRDGIKAQMVLERRRDVSSMDSGGNKRRLVQTQSEL